ncbi:restriction endonuclease subunit S [Vibrio cholerae]|uniref:restriction endonuclease subunit S n=1 Tax=Vibrio cholerae TaxID=666 RepID=UPI0028BC7848|nr:restriction endonuclease subunit S [Vibrio cholerae]HDZ3777649.1 restriction endonuclease subunit S [Vibrio cholerae]
MSQLPKGWVGCKLGNVVDYGKTVKADMTNIDDETWVLELEDLEKDSSKILQRVSFSERKPKSAKNAFKTGDVLYGKLRPYLNKMVVAPEDGICTSEIIPLKVPTGLLDNRFLFYWLKGRVFGDYVNAVSYGVNMPRLGTKDGLNAPMVLAPLAEQTRIVEKLDEVLAQVDTIKARLDGIPAILKRFRQSVLAAAVSGKLTEEWRGKNVSGCAESELNANFSRKSGKLKLRGKQANLNELSLLTLPSSWTWTQNYKLAKDASNAICAGPFGTIFKAKDFRDEGVPIIFLRHVKEDGFNQHKPNYMDRAVWEELHQEYSVHGGELLVTKLGDPPGECCIYPENTGTSMVTPDVLKMDVDEQSAEKKYLRSYFNSPISTEIIEKLAFGATRLRIDIAMFKAFPVPLPPMEEQKEIVRLVDQYFAFADTIEAQVKKAQARVDKLTQSILAKAFRGELVPQDPNDEPADKLLERIAAARKEAEALAKAAKKAAKK